MLLPVPEVQVVTVLPLSDIIQIEAFGIRIRRCPFTADHDIVARLVPEVIIVVHALGFVFPTPRYFEFLVKQQETTRRIALLVTEHRDHHMTISETVNGVRRAEIHLFLDLFRFDYLMQFWGSFSSDIDNMNTARSIARQDEKASRFAWISVTGTTGMPAKMVELIAAGRHGVSVDHLLIGCRYRINIDRREIIWF